MPGGILCKSMELRQFGLASSILEGIWAPQTKCLPMQPIKATPR